MNVFEHVSAVTAESQSWEVDSFTPYEPQEIAYAMAGLSKLGSKFVWVKYALSLEDMRDLSYFWWRQHDSMMGELGPELRGKGIIRKTGNMALAHVLRNNPALLRMISDMALRYNLNPHICGVCGGRSNIVLNAESFKLMTAEEAANHKIGEVITCAECGGIGKRPQSMRQRAQIAGISKTTWDRNWEPVFKKMVDDLGILEREWAKTMRNRLRWDTDD